MDLEEATWRIGEELEVCSAVEFLKALFVIGRPLTIAGCNEPVVNFAAASGRVVLAAVRHCVIGASLEVILRAMEIPGTAEFGEVREVDSISIGLSASGSTVAASEASWDCQVERKLRGEFETAPRQLPSTNPNCG